jgi:uncharacterized protein (DUF1800 family)
MLTSGPAFHRRRTLVRAAGAAALAPASWLTGCAQLAGSPRADTDAAADARHYRLANRLSWGATDAELERVRRLGAAAYIDEQLRAAAGPMPAAAQAQIDAMRVQQRRPAELWVEIDAARKTGAAQPSEEARKAALEAYQQSLNKLAREAASRHLLRALYSPNQLLEQMQWFWFNHFNVHQYKGNLRVLLADYEEQAIRPHALGRFRELLGAVTRHPAMLRYLDNEQNAAARLNENHARELLELHTLGVDGGYTQRDVQELARVLTGHGVNFNDRTPNLNREQAALYQRAGLYEFNPRRHDFGDKTLLGLRLRGHGSAELDAVLDTLAAHPATARFVSRKIARQLLADEPPEALVQAMAAAFQHSDGRIAEVLGVLLRSPEFAVPAPAKFKDPMHFVVSAVRACYGERVLLNTAPLQAWLNRMGQGLYNRQTPDGYPSTAASWIGSGQLAVRLDIARTLGSGSAGLFKSDDPMVSPAARESGAFPQLTRPIYWQVLRPALAGPTREALDAAATPQDWNTLYLASPEFMYC